MNRRSTYAALALASSTVVLIAGCGSSSSGNGGSSGTQTTSGNNSGSQDPTSELKSAVTSLGNAQTITATIKLGADAAAIQKLAQSSGSTLTDTQASAIAGVQLAIEEQAPSGKTVGETNGSTSGAASDFTISDNGTTYLSFRSVDKTFYLQVDLKDLLTAIGETSALSEITTLEASPQLPAFVKSLIDGKWVSLPASAADSLIGSAATDSPSPQQQQALLSGLESILTNDVTVTQTGTGTLSLQANSKKVLTDFLNTVSMAVPSAASELNNADTSQIPSKNIVLGATVSGGSLTQLSIDLGQFAPAKDQPVSLPLDVNFAKSGPDISAPSGATPVDTQQLGSLFSGFASGLGS